MLLGQSRVFYSMSRDGLVPSVFAAVHPKYRTPYKSNVIFFVFTAAFGAFVTALERWGTMPLKEVIAPAMALARNGFPVSDGLLKQHKYGIEAMQKRFREEWPASARLYLPGNRVPDVGSLFRNDALARTFDYLANAKDPLEAFYKGEIAAEIGLQARGTLPI